MGRKTTECIGAHKKSYDLEVYSVTQEVPSFDTDNEKEPRLKCRYLVTFAGFWVFFLLQGYRLNMSVNIVAMVNNSAVSRQTKGASQSCPDLFLNSSESTSSRFSEEGEFIWSPKIQSYILSSIFAGYVIALMPSARLLERFGFKWLLFGSSLVTSLTTLLIPVLSWTNVNALIAVQFLRGVSQAFSQPAGSVLAANWYPRSERGFLYPIMQSGLCLGGIFGSMIAGYLCDSAGRWPASFYTFGALGILASASIALLVFETPDSHPRISKAELRFILSDQENVLTKRRPNPPWIKILTSVPVYALAFAMFGQSWVYAHFMSVQPIFLSTILNYPIDQNGLLVAASFLVMFAAINAAAWLTSLMFKKQLCSVDFARKFWTMAACVVSSASLLGIYLAGCRSSLSVLFAIVVMASIGFGVAGCWGVAADMSPTFVATINGFCLTLASFSSVLEPLLVGYLTEGMQTLEQWNKVFFVGIAISMSSGIVFWVFGSAEVQAWNFVQEDNNETDGKDKY